MKQYVGYVNFSGTVPVYFEAEDGADETALTLAAMDGFYGLDPLDIASNVSLAEVAGTEAIEDMEETL